MPIFKMPCLALEKCLELEKSLDYIVLVVLGLDFMPRGTLLPCLDQFSKCLAVPWS